jgi:hypothetical protein
MNSAVQPISDEDLVLFHYRDELSRERMQEIEEALFLDAGLRLRLAALRETLATASEAWPQPEADAGLEARIWERLAPALPKRRAPEPPSWLDWRSWFCAPRNSRIAFASLLLAALGIGYLLGRPSQPAPDGEHLLAEDASRRVLAAYLAAHLEDTERALLVASNSPGDGRAASELAVALLDSNRLYALAAERAGKPALGQFLRELEPVLIELANEDGSIEPGLGDEIRRRDLTFKTRAAAALARNEAAPSTLQSL